MWVLSLICWRIICNKNLNLHVSVFYEALTETQHWYTTYADNSKNELIKWILCVTDTTSDTTLTQTFDQKCWCYKEGITLHILTKANKQMQINSRPNWGASPKAKNGKM